MPTPDVSLEAFQRYLSGVKSYATTQKYVDYTARFLKLMEENGYTDFKSLPPGLLGEFISMLKRQDKQASTVRLQVFAIQKYLAWVRLQGVEVPIQVVTDLPKQQIRHRAVLPTSMFTDFFRHADLTLREPIRTAVMLLPCCGLRSHELITLKLDQIHRAEVKLQNGRRKNTLFIRLIGKGGKERNVPLMEEGVEILTGYLRGWRKRQKGSWLFPKSVEDKTVAGKKHISDRNLRFALQVMREPMGMVFTPHTMRRTYITMLWRKGLDLALISKIAGHANVQTTLNHYIVMDPTESITALHNAGNSLTE